EWVHVQLHQQKGMISLSPPTICNSAAQGKAPDWWTDLDCEVSLPREEKRISTFLSTQKKRITLQMCLS
ncbi:hypothetical protein ACHWGK_25570, partial [Klebsiella pneumoniae]